MSQILTWVTTLAALSGFGLSLGLNPALYGATADMLARGLPVRARLAFMISGLWVGTTALFLVLQTFNPTSLVSTIKHRAQDELFNRTVDLTAASCSWCSRAASQSGRRTHGLPRHVPPSR